MARAKSSLTVNATDFEPWVSLKLLDKHLLIYFLRHPIKLKFNIYVATQYLKNMSHPKKVLISSQ